VTKHCRTSSTADSRPTGISEQPVPALLANTALETSDQQRLQLTSRAVVTNTGTTSNNIRW